MSLNLTYKRMILNFVVGAIIGGLAAWYEWELKRAIVLIVIAGILLCTIYIIKDAKPRK